MDPSGMVHYLPSKGGYGGFFKFLICCVSIAVLLYYGSVFNKNSSDCADDYSLQEDLHSLKEEVDGVQGEIMQMKVSKVTMNRQLESIEDMLKGIKPANCTITVQTPPDSPPTQNPCKAKVVKALIRDALDEYNADKTGKVDYALESSGGRIISTPETKPYDFDAPIVSLLGIPICQFKKTARSLIQPSMMPGDCWAFGGTKGNAIIQLLAEVRLSGVTLEHISRRIAPGGHIRTAPRDFCIFGMKTAKDSNPVFLGRFTYQQRGPPLQQFDIRGCKEAFRYIKFSITSNHGDPNYTCVYRLRVHGTLEN